MNDNNWANTLGALFDLRNVLTQRLLWSLIIIAILLLTRWLLLRLLRRQQLKSAQIYRWNKTINYIVTALGVLLMGSLWLRGFTDIVTYLGLLSAGLAIALRDPIVNLAAWVFILTRRPFVLGDRIELAGMKGDVVDIRLFAFTLMEVGQWVGAEQSTGRLLHIPNATVFNNSVANYTQGFQFIWNEIPIVITFESNWRKAKGILVQIIDQYALNLTPTAEAQLRQTANQYMITVGALTPKVYTNVVADGVQLTCRYLTQVRKRRGSEEAIWEEILKAFAQEPDIDLAYSTQRVYFNPLEGKPGAGGKASE